MPLPVGVILRPPSVRVLIGMKLVTDRQTDTQTDSMTRY